jgi:hypothetical protein
MVPIVLAIFAAVVLSAGAAQLISTLVEKLG